MDVRIEKLIETIRQRHLRNKERLIRFDQRQNLVYGLCKGEGIDATGMTPEEAWKALEDKTGVASGEWLEKAGEKGTNYQSKAVSGDDLDGLKVGGFIIYNNGIYMKFKDGSYSHIATGKTLKKGNLIGEEVTLINDDLEDSVLGGKEFNKHKLTRKELDGLKGKEFRVIHNNIPYMYDEENDVLESPDMKTIPVKDLIGKDVRIFEESKQGGRNTAVQKPKPEKEKITIEKSKSQDEPVSTGGKTEFSGGALSDDRMEAARKRCINRSDEDADADFREYSGKVWDELNERQKGLVKDYSTNNDHYNAQCRGIRYYDNFYWEKSEKSAIDKNYETAHKDINELAGVIEKCEIPQDAMLFRGVDYYGAEGMFGKDIQTILKTNPQSIVGTVGRDPAFLSTSVSNHADNPQTKFDHAPIQMRIYAPKGTKGMYVQPVSKYGDKGNDYKGELSDVRYEMEMLLQRGTCVEITGVKYVEPDYWGNKDGYWVLECKVTGQEYELMGAPTGKEKGLFKKVHW